ncbi:hypothetical protein H6P81_015658 [Aristolochia fimbriata]|uniref:TIP49 P-loop domain-containing protein n=1 Tax=Aristolochia fimbriata TaxID=158543 RepID=A0AAV7EAR9_ARIFI|nr:hypothetical protein H6P81_015658 [Aristolochia fimbriata]
MASAQTRGACAALGQARIRPSGKAIHMAAGFVGQVGAREAAGVVVDMIRQKKTIGQALPLTDPSGTTHFNQFIISGICWPPLCIVVETPM